MEMWMYTGHDAIPPWREHRRGERGGLGGDRGGACVSNSYRPGARALTGMDWRVWHWGSHNLQLDKCSYLCNHPMAVVSLDCWHASVVQVCFRALSSEHHRIVHLQNGPPLCIIESCCFRMAHYCASLSLCLVPKGTVPLDYIRGPFPWPISTIV